MAKEVLIQNGGEDEVGESKPVKRTRALFACIGTWGGASVKIAYSINGSDFVYARYEDGSDVEITEDVIDEFAQYVVSEYTVRAEIIGGDGTTDITVTMS